MEAGGIAQRLLRKAKGLSAPPYLRSDDLIDSLAHDRKAT